VLEDKIEQENTGGSDRQEGSISQFQSVRDAIRRKFGATPALAADKAIGPKLEWLQSRMPESGTPKWLQQLDRDYQRLKHSMTNPGYPHFFVAVADGKPYVMSLAKTVNQTSSKNEQALLYVMLQMQLMLRILPGFPNVVFFLSYQEHATVMENAHALFPGFTLIPTNESTNWFLGGWPSLTAFNQACSVDVLQRDHPDFLKKLILPWEKRVAKAHFSGRPSSASRWLLDKISQSRSDLFDVSVLKVFDSFRKVSHGSRSSEEIAKDQESGGNAFTQEGRHKYAIYVDGSTAPYRGARMFSTGSLILRVEGKCDPKPIPDQQNDIGQCYDIGRGEPIWFMGLQPWEHYVPIHANMDNLVDTIEYLKENDSLAKRIAQAGSEFRQSALQAQGLLGYIAMAILHVAEMQAPMFAAKQTQWARPDFSRWLENEGFEPAFHWTERSTPARLRLFHGKPVKEMDSMQPLGKFWSRSGKGTELISMYSHCLHPKFPTELKDFQPKQFNGSADATHWLNMMTWNFLAQAEHVKE
jgi:hypothetical protein